MTFKQACASVDKWQKRLLLQEWDISLVAVEDTVIQETGRTAEVTVSHDARKAEIVLCLKDKDAEENILHEMLHIALAPMCRTAISAFDMLGKEARAILDAQYESFEEQLVSRLVRCWPR